MVSRKLSRFAGMLVALAIMALLVACGGGGGGSSGGRGGVGGGGGGGGDDVATVSGTAAAGAPIVGVVSAKDALGNTVSATIEPDGTFVLDVTDLQAPYLLFAQGVSGGTAYTLLSVAFAGDVGGTVNITPLTDLVVGNAVGENPLDFFNNPNFEALTEEAVAEQSAALKERLQPMLEAMGVGADFDLMSTPFVADRSGFDAALDVIRVRVAPGDGTVVIENRLTGDAVNNTFQAPEQDVLPAPDETVISDAQAIAGTIRAFVDAIRVPEPTRDSLEVYLHDLYLVDGEDKESMLDLLTNAASLAVRRDLADAMSNYELLSISGDQASIRFGDSDRDLERVDGSWLLLGNGRQWAPRVHLAQVSVNGGPLATRINLSVRASDALLAAGTYFVLTGEGVPAGTQLTRFPFNDSKFAELPQWTNAVEASSIDGIEDGELYYMTRYTGGTEDIGPGGHVSYTGGTEQETYTVRILKRPVRSGENVALPTITSPASPAALGRMHSGSHDLSWTLPTGYRSVHLSLDREYENETAERVVDQTLQAGQTRLTVTLGASDELAYQILIVRTEDAFGRRLNAELNAEVTGVDPDPAPGADALIGTWLNDDEQVAVTFLPGGKFVLVHGGEVEPGHGQPGMEYGSYTWDPVSGAFEVVVLPIDQNGDWGLSDPNGPVTVEVNGNVMTYHEGGLLEPSPFTRAPTGTGTLVGSWYLDDGDYLIVQTFLPDLTYFHAEVGPDDEAGQSGQEIGTYTWNAGVLKADLPLESDTNGEWGLSHPEVDNPIHAVLVEGGLVVSDGHPGADPEPNRFEVRAP